MRDGRDFCPQPSQGELDLQEKVTELELEAQEHKKEIAVLTERLRLAYELISDTIYARKEQLTIQVWRDLCLARDLCDTNVSSDDARARRIPARMKQEEIIVSCDASITKNPGGDVAVGFVIRFPPEKGLQPVKMAKRTPSQSNNEGEYDAIYEALVTLFNLYNNPGYEVVVHSDSQLVVKQLHGEYQINSPALKRKAESIHELAAQLPVGVRVEWRPRNSTEDLAEANFLAQDEIGVRRH